MTQPKNARRVRPNMPHFGIHPEQRAGMLTWDWVERQMIDARNYWICTTRADGRPHAAPVWGVYIAGAFYFGTDKASVKARNISRDRRVALHLESGDEALIFEGEFVPARATDATRREIDAEFFSKYGLYPELDEEDALLYQLIPRKVLAWLESDYPATATCWLFDDRSLN